MLNLDFDKTARETAIAKALYCCESYVSPASILLVINMKEPSYRERLHVVDISSKTVLLDCHVAHGTGSSAINKAYADKFSNTPESHMSSLGAMKTAGMYQGKHGLSMRLVGLEKQNSNVASRNIVIHQADYMTKEFIRANGRAGQSFGCPAVSPQVRTELFNLMDKGAFVYIYY